MLIKSIVFADDTNFFYSGDNLSQVCETVSTELGKLHSWCQINTLSLNIAKTNVMVFGNKQCDNRVVSINGMNIKGVYVTTFIGVHIDSHLNWCEHINHIKRKKEKNPFGEYLQKSNTTSAYYSETIHPYLPKC